jgi:hypothetical protein
MSLDFNSSSVALAPLQQCGAMSLASNSSSVAVEVSESTGVGVVGLKLGCGGTGVRGRAEGVACGGRLVRRMVGLDDRGESGVPKGMAGLPPGPPTGSCSVTCMKWDVSVRLRP